MTPTERILGSMLKENTGIHFMDSGGANNRHWQKNQSRHFPKEPQTFLSLKRGYIEVCIDVFHFLNKVIRYESNLNKAFMKFCKITDPSDHMCWLELMEEFVAHLKDRCVAKEESFSDNSYNHPNLISQEIQYTYFDTNGFKLYGIDITKGHYVLLQIHGGCDVRGNYTNPKAFSLYDEYSITNFSRASIHCAAEHEHVWDTDNAYHWRYAGIESPSVDKTDLHRYDVAYITDEKDWKKGMLCIDKDQDVGYCPVCGGILTAYC